MILLLQVAAIFFLICDKGIFGQTYSLNIRVGDKICTQWISPVGGSFSISYSPQQECTTNPAFEQANGQARLCCTGLPLTTIAPNFPKECGKQLYQPLRPRIILGNQANANSWVSHS